MKWSVTWALALVVVTSALLHAAPRSKGKAQNANAKTVDVFKAITDKQVNAQVGVQGVSATLTLTNLTEEPLNVKVPLAVAALPQPAPQGANQQAYNTTAFGTPSPQPLAVAVSPLGAAGVDKKSRKTGVKTVKKKAGDDAEEKKDDDKDAKKADEKKETESLEASVLLAPGASQPLSLFALSLDGKKVPASYGAFTLSELDKVSESAEMKALLEKVSQGVVPRNVAQTLAWHYHGRLSWDEMANQGLGTLVALETAKQYADVVEGKTPATPAVTTSKKKKRAISDE